VSVTFVSHLQMLYVAKDSMENVSDLMLNFCVGLHMYQ